MLKAIIIIAFLGWLLWFAYINFDEAFGPVEQTATVICADDVGFCADGTAVAREGPNCQFTSCQ